VKELNVQEQAQYIRKYLNLVIDDLKANVDRLLDEDCIAEFQDYDNVAVFGFGNHVTPIEGEKRIYYHFRIKARE
jgi:hypothetical protein